MPKDVDTFYFHISRLSTLFIEFAERRCGLDGRWEGKSNITSPENSNGWTNYTPCFPPEVQDLLNRLYAGGNEDIVSVSIIALIVLFSRFPRNGLSFLYVKLLPSSTLDNKRFQI